jgi:hypothetical protein
MRYCAITRAISDLPTPPFSPPMKWILRHAVLRVLFAAPHCGRCGGASKQRPGDAGRHEPMVPPSSLVIMTVAERGRAVRAARRRTPPTMPAPLPGHGSRRRPGWRCCAGAGVLARVLDVDEQRLAVGRLGETGDLRALGRREESA